MSRDFRPSADFEPLPALAHLSSLVGHHLINSFSAIVNNAEVLRLLSRNDDRFDPEEFHDRIIRNAIEASQVARKLIDLVRPATRPINEQADLACIIRDVANELKNSCPPTIDWRIDTRQLPVIQGSLVDLSGMFRSILVNSIEAIGERKGRVEIGASLDERSWIVVEIKDDGVGMTEAVSIEAVTPFFSTKPGRLGIGLSVASSVWRRHRGSLSIASRPGEGTMVRLTLDPGMEP